MFSSCIQQGFSPWCKVNWMENFLSCRPVVPLEPCQRSLMEIFCKSRLLLLAFHYFCRYTAVYMFHKVPKCLAVELNLFDILLVVYCMLLNWIRMKMKYPCPTTSQIFYCCYYYGWINPRKRKFGSYTRVNSSMF